MAGNIGSVCSAPPTTPSQPRCAPSWPRPTNWPRANTKEANRAQANIPVSFRDTSQQGLVKVIISFNQEGVWGSQERFSNSTLASLKRGVAFRGRYLQNRCSGGWRDTHLELLPYAGGENYHVVRKDGRLRRPSLRSKNKRSPSTRKEGGVW